MNKNIQTQSISKFKKILGFIIGFFILCILVLFTDSALSKAVYDYGSDFSTIISYIIITLFIICLFLSGLLYRLTGKYKDNLSAFLSRLSLKHAGLCILPAILAVFLNIALKSISVGIIVCLLSYIIGVLVFIKAALGAKRIVFALIYTVVIIVGFILIIEIPGRVIFWVKEKYKPSQLYEEDLISYNEPLIGYALRRNLDESFPVWDLKTNSLGFRYYKDLKIPKPDNTYRIFLLGGSTALGWLSAKQDEHITYYMENKLRELNPKKNIEVVNAGVPYYASWNELGLLIYRVLDCEPDMVIVFDGRNDLYYAVNPDWNTVFSGFADKGSVLAQQKRSMQFDPKAIINDALRTSIVFRFMENTIFQKKEQQLMLKRNMVCRFRPEALDYYQSYLKNIAYLCEGRGISLLFAFQPVIYFDKTLSSDEKKRWGVYGAGENYVEMMQKMYPLAEQKVLALNDYHNAGAISLRDIFKDVDKTVYADECHYNAVGNKIIAGHFVDYIIQNKMLEFGK